MKLKITSSVLSAVLALTMAFGSAITAVATTVNTDEIKNDKVRYIENNTTETEMINGDVIVSSTKDFKLSVDVIKAKTVTIVNQGKRINIQIAKGTVKDAIEKSGLKLTDKHTVIPSGETEITKDMTVKLVEGKEVSVKADGKTVKAIVPSGNVAETLKYMNIKCGKEDILSYDEETEIWDGIEIEINRVRYAEESEIVEIAHESKTESTDELEVGESKLKTKGVNGEEKLTKRVKYIDDEKVGEEVIDRETVKEPVNEVTLIGSKGISGSVAGTFTDSSGNTVAYSRVLTGSGTAYTAPAGSLTATGNLACYGGVAVNPNIIPYGSRLYIESTDGSFVYGYATAIDTGGALMSGSAIVDCYYSTYAECAVFGRRNVNVYVLS
ncbi:MAG: G5 domain-containing protein, partial [Ruminococcus sp.]|nr:G5 domain-containing protein [Ruminococcus sp.]